MDNLARSSKYEVHVINAISKKFIMIMKEIVDPVIGIEDLF